jgi:hypothetical protein
LRSKHPVAPEHALLAAKISHHLVPGTMHFSAEFPPFAFRLETGVLTFADGLTQGRTVRAKRLSHFLPVLASPVPVIGGG